jgi:hypothetical protein
MEGLGLFFRAKHHRQANSAPGDGSVFSSPVKRTGQPPGLALLFQVRSTAGRLPRNGGFSSRSGQSSQAGHPAPGDGFVFSSPVKRRGSLQDWLCFFKSGRPQAGCRATAGFRAGWANHHRQAIPRPAMALFFQVRSGLALLFQVRSTAGRGPRKGLGSLFRAVPHTRSRSIEEAAAEGEASMKHIHAGCTNIKERCLPSRVRARGTFDEGPRARRARDSDRIFRGGL